MSHADFVHLHLHTEFSMLDGACRLDRLASKARDLKFPALAITDHGVLYGAVDFYKEVQEKGIKPIIGCEVYVAPGARTERKGSRESDIYHHLVLLAKDEAGYRNLIKLVTLADLEGFYHKPRIDRELIARHHEGLIALTACLSGEIPKLLKEDRVAEARQVTDWYKSIFGADNFYLEVQNHGSPEEARVTRHMVQLGREFGLKLVATNDVHYIEKEHSHAHDILVCIGTQTTIEDPNRMSLHYAPEQYYLRSAEEMKGLFAEIPEAVQNTLEVAEKCNVLIEFGKLYYPVFNPPSGQTREGCLRELISEGLQKRYGLHTHVENELFIADRVEEPARLPTYAPEAPLGHSSAGDQDPSAASVVAAIPEPRVAQAAKALLDRLEMELKVIEKTGFISYFLIVGDFVKHGRSKGISCVARGSAAGSIVTYLLEISNVDPIRYGLLFERFLNPERVNPPDIDIDFADDRRAEVIEYVREKYGRDCVAQIITFGTMGAKSVVRDVGRVMGLEYAEGDRLAKMIPADLKLDKEEKKTYHGSLLRKAVATLPDLKQAYESEETTHDLIEVALVLEDLTRNASVHAAGVVIGGQPLVNLLPLKQDEDKTIVTQYAMGPVGDLGLLKMDFLGLKTLTVIRNTCDLVRQTRGIEVPIDQLPLDDALTYDLLNKANTIGIFQLESSGMRDLCRKFKIASVEHITALIALYRPGPMDWIPDFIKRRNGETKIEYEHPLLEPLSKETYGVLVYQEQVMQAAQALAGFTLGGADVLRRAMGKKKQEEMDKQRANFVKGCATHHHIPEDKANQIFNMLDKFAGYGFNKSHAAAYAIVAYQTAYLKAHYPVEFLSAMLTNDMNDTAKLGILIAEAREMSVEVLPPDVNESQVVFAPAQDGKVIRFGMAAIKGVGEGAVECLLKARNKGGRFQTLFDLCERVDGRTVNRKALEALIKCGACDSLKENRATLFAQMDRALGRAASVIQDRQRGQSSLFGLLEAKSPPVEESMARLPEWPQHQLLAAEKELLGFYVTGHPLSPYIPIVERYATHASGALAKLPNRTMTRLGGMVAAVQSGISKKSGKPYLLATLEDLDGSVQVLCLNENHDKFRELFVSGKALLIIGEVNNGEDKPKLFPVDVLPLEEAPRRYTKQVHLRLHTGQIKDKDLTDARAIVQAHPGRCPLFLCLRKPGGEVIFLEAHDEFRVQPGMELQKSVNERFGEETYYAKVDLTLPERPRRQWEQRGGEGQGRGGENGG